MKPGVRRSFLYKNGLGLTVLAFMIICIVAQFITGWHTHNNELQEEGQASLSIAQYATSGHFIQATFENWESEFLQMALYVLLTIGLRQEGSSESKKIDEEEDVDRDPAPHKDAPWPVRRGGLWLKVYSNSLSLAFSALFIICFLLHFYGSLKSENEERSSKGLSSVEWTDYFHSSRFWFESFQNWQSEFLAVASIVLLSIWLRQKGSPESKPVDAPHKQTGS
jgi:hypothetical protein